VTVDIASMRAKLTAGDFAHLFVEDLGWDHNHQSLSVEVNDTTYTLTACAEKRGMVVFECRCGSDDAIPDAATRRKIDRQVAQLAREHIIIYTNADRSTQIWQWVRREPGRPERPQEITFQAGQYGQRLLDTLRELVFPLEIEEGVTLLDVTGRVRAAFDVDRVTKKFYELFKKQHDTFLSFIEGIEAQDDREWYASLMLNRLMFVYFIQKKGFLDDDPDYLRNRLKMVQARSGEGEFLSFYRHFLLRLFHEGLGQPISAHTSELDQLIGRVPYLNGGLFDLHQLEAAYPEIQIADDAFQRIFEFFDEYQWRLDDRPLRDDREINPDVLGYIFEKYINQKQMGAYYSKEDITEYIGKNTIIPYLFDAARKNCAIAFRPDSALWALLREDPNRYIYAAVLKGVDLELPPDIAVGIDDVSQRVNWNRPADDEYALPTETWREHVARRQRCLEVRAKLRAGEVTDINDLITLNLDIRQFAQDAIEYCEGVDLLRAFYGAIRTVTVLDPTCGSGAFLFAALNILKPLYEACLGRMEDFLQDLERSEERHGPRKYSDFAGTLDQVRKHPNRNYFILKSIILNNLYGVDIMEEAVEIAKLRLFLTLVAQVEDRDHVEPLPDIDFNIRAGNTLVGFATYEDAERAITSKFDWDNTLQRIKERAEDVDRLFDHFHRQQTEYGGEITRADKHELRGKLLELAGELNEYLASEYGVDTSSRTVFERWHLNYAPFNWFVEFYGIMKRGGFDVVIGNPPYIELNKIKPLYEPRGYQTAACGNLYCLILERCSTLTAKSGFIGMIVPLSLSSTARMDPLRRLLNTRLKGMWLSHFSGDANPSVLFEGVKFRLDIILGRRSGNDHQLLSSAYEKWFHDERPALFSRMSYEKVAKDMCYLSLTPKVTTHTAADVLTKLRAMPPLVYSMGGSGKPVYVHRVITMFVKCFDFVPYFCSDQDGQKRSEDYKEFIFPSDELAEIAVALLNSTTFFHYFIAYGDCFHCGKEFVEMFPAGLHGMPVEVQATLRRLGGTLMSDMQQHAVRRKAFSKQTGHIEYDEFWPRYSKPIIDEIDIVLARHYGFTDS
jgi:Eco57I restriction-modification methylase